MHEKTCMAPIIAHFMGQQKENNSKNLAYLVYRSVNLANQIV